MVSMTTAFGTPEGIRIPDLPLRRRTLYPAELLGHIIFCIVPKFSRSVNPKSAEAAKKGVVIENLSESDPIVMLKHFAENPDLEKLNK